MAEIGILNVGAGDTKLVFDKNNPAECIRAARIVKDMLRRGYALLVDVGEGKTQRVLDFDETQCEYIIADLDPVAAEAADREEQEHGEGSTVKASKTGRGTKEKKPDPLPRGRRSGTRRVSATRAGGVAVARTAGG